MLDLDNNTATHSNLVVGGGYTSTDISSLSMSTSGHTSANIVSIPSSTVYAATGSISAGGMSFNSSTTNIAMISIHSNRKDKDDVFMEINNACGNRLLEITNNGQVRWLGNAGEAADHLVKQLMTSINKQAVTNRAREQFELAVAKQLLLLVESAASMDQLQQHLEDIISQHESHIVERILTEL